MDSGIDSTESSNGSISDTSTNVVDIHSEEHHNPSATKTLEETIQNCSQDLFREPCSISNFKLKKSIKTNCELQLNNVHKESAASLVSNNVDTEVISYLNLLSGKESSCSSVRTTSSNFLAEDSMKLKMKCESEVRENEKNSDESILPIPRAPVPFTIPELLEFPVPEGCCLKLNFPKIETEFAVQQEQALPFETTTTPSFANGPFQINCNPEPYSGSLAVLPYESRELQRKFKHYRRRLRQIISTKPKEKKLRMAASLNNVELVERLLKDGIDPRATDEKQRTALHIAASKGYTKIAKLLLQNGADPNQKDSIGNTALHLAACTSHIETVTLLLKAGTDVKQADNQGYSPLHLANSRLKLLQKDPNPSSQSLKVQVYQIVEMMQEYLKSSGNMEEAELLTALTSKLTLSEESSTADGDIKQLLASLQDLTLSKTKKD